MPGLALGVVGRVVGALILPSLSDRYRRRTPFMVGVLVGATLGLGGITYASSYGRLMDSFRSPAASAMTPSLVVLIGLMVLSLLLCTRLRESMAMVPEHGKP